MALHNSKRIALLQLVNCISSCDLTKLEDFSNGEFFQNIISSSFPEFVYTEPSQNTTEVSNDEKIIPDKMETEFVVTVTGATLESTGNIESETTNKNVQDSVIESIESSVATESSVVEPTESSVEEPTESSVEATKSCIVESTELSVESIESSVEATNSSISENKNMLQNFKVVQHFIDERYNLNSEEVISYSSCVQADELEIAKVAFFIFSEVVKHFVLRKYDNIRTLAHLDYKVQEDLEECFNLFIRERDNLLKSEVEKVLCNHAKYKNTSPCKRSPFVTPRRSCPSKYRISPSTSTNEDIYSNSPLKSFFESPVFKKEDIIIREREIAKTRKTLHEEELKSEDLQFELQANENQFKEKDKVIQKLKADIRKLQANERETERNFKELEEKYKSLQVDNKHKDEQLINEKKDNSELYSQITLLQGQVQEYENGKKLNKDIGNIRLFYYKCKKSLEEEENKNEKLTTEVEKLTAQVENLQSKLKTEKEESKAKSCKLKEVQKELDNNLKLRNETKESTTPVPGESIGKFIEEENKTLHLELKNAESKIQKLEKKLQTYQMDKPVQNDVPNPKNGLESSMPVLLELSQVTETQKNQNLKRQSTKDTEPANLPSECDNSSNSEASVPKIEAYGLLWQNILDNENDSAMDSQFILPNKNGYNWPPIHLDSGHRKMAKDQALQLEKKEEIIDKLKNTLQMQSEEYKNSLDDKVKIIEELKKQLTRVENEKKAYFKDYMETKAWLKEYQRKMTKRDERIKSMHAKFDIFVAEKDQQIRCLEKQLDQLSRYKKRLQAQLDQSDKHRKELQDNVIRLKTDKQQWSLYIKKLMKGEKKNSVVHTIDESKEDGNDRVDKKFSRRDIKSEEPNPSDRSESSFVELNTATTSRDVGNESLLPGALCRSGLHFEVFNEDDFLNQSSLVEIKRKYNEARVEELMRRNSIQPLHLQSSYPAEMDLPGSTQKFYIKNSQIPDNLQSGHIKEEHEENNKKRKLSEVEPDDNQPYELTRTPVSKMKRRSLKSPLTVKQILSFQRCDRQGTIRSKPSWN